jgi:hypothetical protein
MESRMACRLAQIMQQSPDLNHLGMTRSFTTAPEVTLSVSIHHCKDTLPCPVYCIRQKDQSTEGSFVEQVALGSRRALEPIKDAQCYWLTPREDDEAALGEVGGGVAVAVRRPQRILQHCSRACIPALLQQMNACTSLRQQCTGRQ